jgi:hypothetical protein
MAERAAQAPFPDEHAHWRQHKDEWQAVLGRDATEAEYHDVWQAVIKHPNAAVFEFVYETAYETLPQWGFFHDGVAVVYDVKSDEIQTCLRPTAGIDWLRGKEQSRQLR